MFVLLGIALFLAMVEASVPALWRREGIEYDIGKKNLGNRGVDGNHIQLRINSDQNQMKLIEEAYRWLNNLETRKNTYDNELDNLQMDVRDEEHDIDELSQEVDNNKQQIQQLQNTICSLLESMCEQKVDPCMPCPWISTVAPTPMEISRTPELTTAATNNVTTTTTTPKPPTPRPSPDPSASCGEPASPPNGYVEKNGTNLNSLIFLHCNSGFDLIGESKMICTAIWSASDSKYQYSWAPPMSVICKANGNPTPKPKPTTTTSKPVVTKPKPVTTTVLKPTFQPGTISISKSVKTMTLKPGKMTKSNISGQDSSTKKKIAPKRLWVDSFRIHEQHDSLDRRGFPERCFEPMEVGVCKASLPRYFYNKEKEECEFFNYGGCKGNKNNFETLKECQTICS